MQTPEVALWQVFLNLIFWVCLKFEKKEHGVQNGKNRSMKCENKDKSR